MRRHAVSLVCAVSLVAFLGCEEKPSAPAAAQSSPPIADVPPTAAPVVPTPAPTVTEPPPVIPKRPKKKLADCAKGPNVEFEQKEMEAEIRKKLPKPQGPLTAGDLAKVRSLNVSQIKLTELDVCVFSKMRGLKELFLGPGDYDDLSPISVATQLESLRASINQVRDLKPLESLTKLDRLDLGRTQVSDLTPLAKLKALSELQLDDTPVEDVSPLAGLTNLETLSLKRTRVKDVSALKNLKKLKFLYTAGSPLDADPMSVSAVRANGTKVIAE